jgi:biopolymer transport protein ExbB
MKATSGLVLSVAVLVGSAGAAHAGEVDEAQATMERLHQSVRQGIWGLLPVMVGGGALLALLIQRRLAYRARVLFPPLLADELFHVGVSQRVDRERLSSIVEAKASLLSDVVKSILRTAKCSVLERSQLAQDVIATETSELKRGNNYFDVLYACATLLGLLGALVGLIDAFALQAAHPEGLSNAVVTAAVAPALCATAAGVILAILARIVGEYIKGLHEKRKVQLERLVRPLILAMEPPAPVTEKPMAQPTNSTAPMQKAMPADGKNGRCDRIDLVAG